MAHRTGFSGTYRDPAGVDVNVIERQGNQLSLAQAGAVECEEDSALQPIVHGGQHLLRLILGHPLDAAVLGASSRHHIEGVAVYDLRAHQVSEEAGERIELAADRRCGEAPLAQV